VIFWTSARDGGGRERDGAVKMLTVSDVEMPW
jgi:hypothetical protein